MRGTHSNTPSQLVTERQKNPFLNFLDIECVVFLPFKVVGTNPAFFFGTSHIIIPVSNRICMEQVNGS